MKFEATIGLEIHAELATKTKTFCSCKNEFGAKPNTNVCPVCLGLYGALPRLNKKAVELAVKAGLCFESKINKLAYFERKNYFYPDLSKGYQISQLKMPFCVGGFVELDSGKKVHLNRIQLEEDAGKLLHISKTVGTKVDYNRGGTPLIEIVTEPELCCADEAVEFVQKVREILVFAGIAHCKMEQGGLRADVNVSIRPVGAQEFGTKVEMKNINSFRAIKRAIDFEIARQTEILQSGKLVEQETRKWDDVKCKSFAMRNKENSKDYRYFEDPDIMRVRLDETDISRFKAELPMLAKERRQMYEQKFGLSHYEAERLTSSVETANFFEECEQILHSPKKLASWIIVGLFSMLVEGQTLQELISPQHLCELENLVQDGKITKNVADTLLKKVVEQKQSPTSIAQKESLLGGVSKEQIANILKEFAQENPKAVQDFWANPDKVILFVVGYVKKKTQGKADTELVKVLAKQILNKK